MINPEPRLYVDVADTPAKQARGLMFVKDMPNDQGMLFAFSRSHELSFWGENTYIPLDIAFANADGFIKNIETIAPLNRRPVKSRGDCLYAIEANAGFFEDNGIKVGDRMNLADLGPGGHCISFEQKRRKSAVVKGNQLLKKSQLMGNEYGFDVQDAQREAEEEARQRYEALPSISPNDIGEILVDNDFEPQPDQLVDQPGDMPQPPIPEIDMQPPEPSTEEQPQFENVFDAVDEFAKPTNQNSFMGNPMRIDYTTKSGKQIAREIEPHGTFHADTTGNQILVSYDRTAGGIRAFIMQNIKAFALLDDKFEPKFRVEQ